VLYGKIALGTILYDAFFKRKKPMQQLLITLIVLCGVGASLPAQVVLNPKAGIHFTNLEANSNDLAIDGANGFQAGVDFRVGNKPVFFNPGIHYFSSRNNIRAQVLGVEISDESRVQQLRLPLAVGLRLNPREDILAFRVKAGVQPTFRLGVEEVGELPFAEDDVRSFRTDALIGIGVDIALLFTFDVQYAVGLQEYLEEGTGTEGYLLLSAGIKFGRGNALYGR